MPIYKANGKKDGLQKYLVRINYISNSGKAQQLTRTAYGLEAAKDLERKLAAEQKGKGDTPAKKMTVQQLFDEYINVKQYKIKEVSLDKCRRTFVYHILPMFKDVRIDRLTVAMLQEWKVSMEERLTAKQTRLLLGTKQHTYHNFNAMLNYAVNMEYLPKNPLSKVGNFTDTASIKKEIQYYTAQEFQQFINAAKEYAGEREVKYKDLSEWDYYVFFSIAFYTGLRKGEIHAAKWSDINGKYISVKRSVMLTRIGEDRETSPKNKSSIRTLQMPLPLIKILDTHKKRQSQLKSFSDEFRICGGEVHLRDSTISGRNAKFAKLSGLKRIKIHEFRHSHVSILANEGINIQEISRRLGHAKIEMTWNTYSHLYPREEERAVEVLNTID